MIGRLTLTSRAASLIDTLAISYHPVIHPVSRTVYGKDAPRIIDGFLWVGLSIEIKLVKLLQQEQRLILDEFSHVRAVFCCFVIGASGASEVLNRLGMFSFPLPRSLSRYAPAVRLRRATGASTRSERSRDVKGKAAKPFFLSSAP